MSKTHGVAAIALQKLLRPMVRFLLRQGIAYGEFAEYAKKAYVDVANEEFAVPGRKQSQTRVSVLTGIHRHEVAKLLRLEPIEDVHTNRHNRAARVISSWQSDPDFSKNGIARTLSINIEFPQLVARHGADVTVRSILDELQRVGAVEITPEHRVKLLVTTFTPQDGVDDLLHILGDSVTDLLSTLDHNIANVGGERRLQMSVVYTNLPDEALRNLEVVSRDQAMKFLEDLNRFYASQDRDTNPQIEGKGRNRAGIGLYYFQHPFDLPSK